MSTNAQILYVPKSGCSFASLHRAQVIAARGVLASQMMPDETALSRIDKLADILTCQHDDEFNLFDIQTLSEPYTREDALVAIAEGTDKLLDALHFEHTSQYVDNSVVGAYDTRTILELRNLVESAGKNFDFTLGTRATHLLVGRILGLSLKSAETGDLTGFWSFAATSNMWITDVDLCTKRQEVEIEKLFLELSLCPAHARAGISDEIYTFVKALDILARDNFVSISWS